MKNCIIYVATGSINYLFCASLSAATCREQGNNSEIIIITDSTHQVKQKISQKYNIKFITIDKQEKSKIRISRNIKTNIDRYAIFRKNLYIDSDTIILGKIDDFEKYIGRDYDILLPKTNLTIRKVKDKIKKTGKWGISSSSDIDKTIKYCGIDKFYYNSGVFGWVKNNRTKKFFDLWNSEWNIHKHSDEPAFMRALYNCDIKLNIIDKSYHLTKNISEDTKIYHHIHGCIGKDLLSLRIKNIYLEYYYELYKSFLRLFGINYYDFSPNISHDKSKKVNIDKFYKNNKRAKKTKFSSNKPDNPINNFNYPNWKIK